MPGPAPKHPSERVRRHATVAMTQLPAEGREGEPPAWPLSSKPSAAAAKIWARVWGTPQAVAWERLGWTDVVARYCRVLVEAEKPKAAVGVMAEARQLEDRLGLSPMSMLRLRWEVVVDEVAEQRTATPARRLKAVDPTGGQTADAVERS